MSSRIQPSNRSPRSRLRGLCTTALMAGSLVVAGLVTSSVPAASASSDNDAATQPAQSATGPGGSKAKHGRWRVTEGGTGAKAWYVFEPVAPRPTSAPLAIVMHGYGEYEGFESEYEFIKHTVLRGSIVIYPRWQTSLATPCPGPISVEPCVDAAVAGIRGALRYLGRTPKSVVPNLEKASYFGHSFGGILTANLANRWRKLNLPKPRVMFLDDPHDGGLVDQYDEPALDESLAGIPRTTLVECHSGADGIIADPLRANGSCNAVFPKLSHIPAARKDLVLTHTDTYGEPDISSAHGVCTAPQGTADAYDWNYCWRVWDALRRAAYSGKRTAFLGDTPRHRSLGTWSDGTPILPLKIQETAPIRR